ncbi:MAG: manganese efflux pump MntP family protein [Woeseiaceae bacterium]
MSLLLLALALSMDAFAAALTQGVAGRSRSTWRSVFTVGFAIGAVHGLMPLLGWGLGKAFAPVLRDFDHWVAFVLLVLLGFRMLREGIPVAGGADPENSPNPPDSSLFMMAIATGVDAGVAGATFDGLGHSVAVACTVIGMTAFLLSGVGVLVGKAAGDAIGPHAQIVGGLVLIGLGIKILIQHLFFGG